MNIDIKKNVVGLMLSHDCNLSCTYCYIPHKSKRTMSLELAQSVLKPRLSLAGEPKMTIEIMGAEPLTAFERLREIVEWVKAEHFPREYFFFATTNGTLLNDEMKAWFHENREIIILCLSYDGTDETQDSNRSHSSGKIDKQFFLDNWPFQNVKYTIPERAIENLAEGIIYLSELGFYIHANPAYEEKEWSESSFAAYERQLGLIVDYYDKHPDKKVASLVNYDLVKICGNFQLPQLPVCQAICGYGIYDVDGESYPCPTLSPLVVGTKIAKQAQDLLLNTQVSFEDPACTNCILKNGCATCMGMNYTRCNDFAKRDITHCKTAKLEALATCVLQKNRLLKKKEYDENDALLAKAITTIYRNLK